MDIRQVTLDGYASWLAPVKRHPIALQPVMDIGIADVQEFVSWLAREGMRPRKGRDVGSPLSHSSIKSVKSALQQVFDLAYLEGTVNRNVVKIARWPRRQKADVKVHPHWVTTGRGEKAFCESLLDFLETADLDPLAGAWRLTACGATRADILGLRWSDVDFDAGIAQIRQGRVALANGKSVIDEPKSAQRIREVRFEESQPGTTALLKRMKAQQAADRLAAGAAWRDTGLVVVDQLGDPIAPQVYSDRFRRLSAAAGVPVINLHSVRHTLNVLWEAMNVNVVDRSASLGHTREVNQASYSPSSGSAGIAVAAAANGRAMARAREARMRRAVSEG